MAAAIKAGSKAYRNRLRAQLVGLGFAGEHLSEHVAAHLITRCDKRPREAWRLASELSLDEVAARGNELSEDARAPWRKNRVWEYEQWPRGGSRPSLPTLRILAQLFGTTWDQLVDPEDLAAMPEADRDAYHSAVTGRGTPTTPRNGSNTVVAHTTAMTASWSRPPSSLGHAPDQIDVFEFTRGSGSPLANLRFLRNRLDETLAASTVSPRQLQMIEETTQEQLDDYPSSSPAAVLDRMAVECVEILTLSRRRQPAAVQGRLSGCAALLATLCADALMRLGETTDARAWYRTAVVAADDSSQPRLGVLVRAQAAMLPYYFGNPQQTVDLADEALALSTAPSSARALAAASRARALARLGAAERARTAALAARTLFDEVGDDDSDAAFRFPAKRLLFYLSGAAAWCRDITTALRLQDEAFDLYRAGASASIDPTLMLIDRAMCLAHDRRAQEAAAVTLEAITTLDGKQRTEIILTRADDVVNTVPLAERHGTVQDLAHYVHECREHAQTLASGQASLDW